MMNSFVSLQKDVALVSLIGPVEILRQAGIDKAKYANFTPYVAASLIFLAITIPCTRLADHLSPATPPHRSDGDLVSAERTASRTSSSSCAAFASRSGRRPCSTASTSTWPRAT